MYSSLPWAVRNSPVEISRKAMPSVFYQNLPKPKSYSIWIATPRRSGKLRESRVRLHLVLQWFWWFWDLPIGRKWPPAIRLLPVWVNKYWANDVEIQPAPFRFQSPHRVWWVQCLKFWKPARHLRQRFHKSHLRETTNKHPDTSVWSHYIVSLREFLWVLCLWQPRVRGVFCIK